VKAKPIRYSRAQAEFDRAIGFIDATFALALTLLVTTLDVSDPGAAFSGLGALDDAVGQHVIAFVIAFAVIASYWLQHHRLIASFTTIASAAVFGASVPIAYLISPVAAQITWISLIPITLFLGRYTPRWRQTIDAA
jgi:uncharacterized membrane protein